MNGTMKEQLAVVGQQLHEQSHDRHRGTRGGARRSGARRDVAALRTEHDEQLRERDERIRIELAKRPTIQWIEPVLLAPDFSNCHVVGIASDASAELKAEFLP